MKRFNITVNGQTYDVLVEEVSGGAADPVVSAPAPAPAPAAASAPSPVAAPQPSPAAPAAPAEGTEPLNAPMPGTIVDIMVKAGDKVQKGQVLLILEAMKMENEIMAPRDAVIAAVHVNKGEGVDSGKLLISLQ